RGRPPGVDRQDRRAVSAGVRRPLSRARPGDGSRSAPMFRRGQSRKGSLMFQSFVRVSAAAAALGAALMVVSPAADSAAVQLEQAPGAGGPRGQAPAQSGGGQVDRQIADLKKQLKITPQQEPQFDAFAQAMRSNAQDMDQLMRQQPGQLNAVEDLKQTQQVAEAQANGLKRLLPPFQALYDVLSDQQKKTADQVLGGGGPGPGPARGGRG